MKGLLRSLARNPTRAPVVKQTIKLNNVALVLAGATGVGFGTAVVGDFPAGNILILGAASYLQVTKDAASTGITATFDGDYSLGTTATADATLSTTDANVIPSTALGAATAGVSPVVRGISAAPAAPLDNTDGSLELNLNLIIDDAAISADAQGVKVSGYVTIAYVVLGDD